MSTCFHCGETIPKGVNLSAKIEGVEQPMCCIGCQAVAQFLSENDHEVFYQYRNDQLPAEQVNFNNGDWLHLDTDEVFNRITQAVEAGKYQATIKIEGMYCSACGWLLQKVLQSRAGISDLHINAVTQNLQIVFDLEVIKLSEIFAQINTLGYQPLQQQEANQNANYERNQQLKKIAVAGFGMMFIMTLAVPLYSPENMSVAPHIQRFFLMISMLIATVVFFYSGMGFVNNAIRDLKNRHLGMDVPVALSIGLAYFVSIYLSFKQQGHVYFDSMTMFIFFLLLGRFIESQVRHKGMNVRESLFALVPVSAEQKVDNEQYQTIPLDQVVKGDVLRVKSGETIPCDGVIVKGQAQVNEAILTGESQLIDKGLDDLVYAGARLVGGEVLIETTVNNQDSFLSKLADLMELAQSKKPASLQLVDQIASYFVATVLLLATITAIWYGFNQPAGLMTALLAVLIATCPCALSLATPTALTAAGVQLLNNGVLVNNTEAITRLDKIKQWYFDKTGTLSDEQLHIKKAHIINQQYPLETITHSLQQISNHPIASAFLGATSVAVENAENHAGKGVSGIIGEQRWLMGSRNWLHQQGIDIPALNTNQHHTSVYLACEQQLVAVYELAVKVRTGANDLLAFLKKQSKDLAIISGDQTTTVKNWAENLSIEQAYGDLTAEDKINYIAQQQQQGKPCVMVGDGVNDAPVLSQADVSISLKQGAYLAHSASDLIVLGKSLSPVIDCINTSHKTNNIIKQNLTWSLLYNLSVTPIAMMGLLAPWMAAIGMSLSSLLVVLNSRRLL